MKQVTDWLERWYYRNVHGIRLRNTLDKSEWDGTIPEPQCCRVMATAVAEGDCPVAYDPVFRQWRLLQLYHRVHRDWELEYCPWCGTALPNEQGDEWTRRVEQLGFTEGGHYSEIPGLPEEYRTDRWWRDAQL